MITEYIFYGWLLFINLIALFLMIADKGRAIGNQPRIPEAYFFLCATLFGGGGILAGMTFLRHKIRKWYFLIGIPWIILQNILSVLFLINYF